MWAPLRHLVGLATDPANAGGNVLARLREIIDNRVGAVNATGGSATAGSANAKLNAIINHMMTSPGGSIPASNGVNGGGGGRFWVFTSTTVWTPPPEANVIRFLIRAGGQGGAPAQRPAPVGDGYYAGVNAEASPGAAGAITFQEVRRLRGQSITVTVGAGGAGRVGANNGGTIPGMTGPQGGTSGTLTPGNGGSSSVTVPSSPQRPGHVTSSGSWFGGTVSVGVNASPSGAPATAGQANTAHSPANSGIGGGPGSLPVSGQVWGGAGANGGSGFVIAWWE